MASLTNSELQDHVRAALGRGGSVIQTNQNSNIIYALNSAMEDMAKETDYPELKQDPVDISTVAHQNYVELSAIITAGGHQNYDLVDQIFSLHAIEGSSYHPIEGRPPRVFRKSFPMHADTDSENRPSFYTIIDQRLYLYPTPDAVYTLTTLYSLWPTPIQHSSGTITAGTDPGQASASNSFRKSDSCIIIGGIYYAYMILSNTEKMRSFYPIFEKQKIQDQKKHGKKLDYYPSGGSWGHINKQTTAPSSDAQSGYTAYDGVFTSTPHWD